MKRILITFIFCSAIFTCYCQNDFRYKINSINTDLISIEKKCMLNKDYVFSLAFLSEKLEFAKSCHRFSENIEELIIKEATNVEFGEILIATTEIALNRIKFLELSMRFSENKLLYYNNYEKSRQIYQSLFLKVK